MNLNWHGGYINKNKSKAASNRIAARGLKKHIKECEICGSKLMLQVHHMDKNHNNNNIENLKKLCTVCHAEQHKGDEVHKAMMAVVNKPQSNVKF